MDTLVYGNIINSRMHHKNLLECQSLLENFRILKQKYSFLKIHGFNLAARVAAYNSSAEDPDYWKDHGYDIWRITYLKNKLE